ncbi:MAG: hypothetical protein RL757_174 [Bacteroidota bacterium]
MKKIGFLLAVSAFALASCGGKKGEADLTQLKSDRATLDAKIAEMEKNSGDSTKKEKSNIVSVMPVVVGNFEHSIDLQGSAVADDEVYITSKVPGTIKNIFIKTGDKVQTGQVVAELDDNMVDQGMAELQNRFELANDLYMKQKSLWEQKIGSEVQYLMAKNNRDALEKTMNTMRETKALYLVKSPISGVVDDALLKPGQAAAPGVPLAKVVNFSKLKVRADVAETYAGRVRAGNAVKIVFADLKKEVPAKITYVGNSVNPMNRTFKVEIALKSNEAGVLPNMLALVKVVDYSNKNAASIPVNLVQKDLDGSDFVLVSTNGRATKRTVKVGQLYNDVAEILSGLKSGDQLINVGFQNVNDGDAIEVR